MLQAQAYVLGNKLVAHGFKKDVFKKTAHVLRNYENIPMSLAIDMARVIYDGTSEKAECEMRELIAAHCASRIGQSEHDWHAALLFN